MGGGIRILIMPCVCILYMILYNLLELSPQEEFKILLCFLVLGQLLRVNELVFQSQVW